MDGKVETDAVLGESSLLVGEAEGEEAGGFLPVSVLQRDILMMSSSTEVRIYCESPRAFKNGKVKILG